MDDDSGTLTWEDVEAVCKLMGVKIVEGFEDNERMVYRRGFLGTCFSDPAAALEFITAEEHPLERNHATILRSQP